MNERKKEELRTQLWYFCDFIRYFYIKTKRNLLTALYAYAVGSRDFHSFAP